ncbi:MFS transporter [Streptomyces benahoarensis]|uniref:MFS transporter n=1 Tax=Streptomyces benahoarensis TaxID=2595054 RepID=A0A553ZMC4_9ACTN|nr:MFS transporter [Streptomyces benahoarensis]TSB22796.1 MFS transporter [Streptomyces benahoarensis]TSB42535.1 MFS transporter [Streptomyces benahoarensis]
MSASVRTTVALLFAAWFIDYVDRLAIATILPAIGDEFALDRGQQGLIMSSNSLASVVAPLAVPPLASVVGWRWAFVLAAGTGALVHLAVRLWLPAPPGSAPRTSYGPRAASGWGMSCAWACCGASP